MNSVYGLLSTETINSLPKVIGSAYLPFYSGCVYAALPLASDGLVSFIKDSLVLLFSFCFVFQGFTITHYNSRPDHLNYYIHEYHVFDLKV